MSNSTVHTVFTISHHRSDSLVAGNNHVELNQKREIVSERKQQTFYISLTVTVTLSIIVVIIALSLAINYLCRRKPTCKNKQSLIDNYNYQETYDVELKGSGSRNASSLFKQVLRIDKIKINNFKNQSAKVSEIPHELSRSMRDRPLNSTSTYDCPFGRKLIPGPASFSCRGEESSKPQSSKLATTSHCDSILILNETNSPFNRSLNNFVVTSTSNYDHLDATARALKLCKADEMPINLNSSFKTKYNTVTARRLSKLPAIRKRSKSARKVFKSKRNSNISNCDSISQYDFSSGSTISFPININLNVLKYKHYTIVSSKLGLLNLSDPSFNIPYEK